MRKFFKKSKKSLSLALAGIMTLSLAGNYYLESDNEAVVTNAEPEGKVYFAQGEGTGNDFESSSWKFAGQGRNGYGVGYDIMGASGSKPGIYANDHTSEHENIIRLIQGVTPSGDSGYEYEAGKNIDYRSGEAFLSEGKKFAADASFSVKFTFSMPDAVINANQAGGDRFAREYGGDGIAFVMTTESTHTTQAGSGIGYQGIGNSIAVEMDSFFNGAYYYGTDSVTGYKNWDFDNQLYKLNLYETTNNYENVGHKERFDHVAITLDGDVKQHKAISYINGIKPDADWNGSKYPNLAYGNSNTSTNTESTSNTCATRFADKNVDNRLFTAWVEYDGVAKKMYVSYAVGKFSQAVRPATPQITYSVDLSSKFGNKDVYMGFTSAVGTSKANHTIHGFEFTNQFLENGFTSNASYNVEYYYQNNDGTYTLDALKKLTISDDINGFPVKVNDTATANGTPYKKGADSYTNYIAYGNKTNYTYANVDGKTVDSISVTEDNNATLKLYYNKDKAYYKLHFFKADLEGNYSEVTSLMVPAKTGFVGETKTAQDAKENFADYFVSLNPGYAYNPAAKDSSNNPLDKSSVKLTTAGETYDMNVYFDPTPATYTVRYHKWNPVTNTEIGTADIPSNKNKVAASVGSTVVVDDTASSVDKSYKNHFASDNYEFYTTAMNKQSVSIVAGDDNYLDLYYVPKTVNYKVRYWKLDPNAPTDKTKAKEDTAAKHDETGYVGFEYKVSDTDSSYKTKYTTDSYEFSKTVTGSDDPSVTLIDGNNEINVYYIPEKTNYSIEFYKDETGSGTYTKVTADTLGGGSDYEVYVGSSKNIKISDYSNKYANFVMTTVEDKTVTNITSMDKDATKNVFKLYYVPKKTSYILKYFVYDVNSDKPITDKTAYKSATPASTSIIDGTVGNTYSAADADASYETRFDAAGYKFESTAPNKLTTGALIESETDEMEAYYVPKKVKYAIRYYKQNEDGQYPDTPTQESDVKTDMWGTTHDAKEFDPNYDKKYDSYTVDTSKPAPEITLINSDEVQYINVYYKPELVKYEIHYWKYDVNAKQFVEVTADKKSDKGLLNSTVKVEDKDSTYKTKYSSQKYEYDNGNEKEVLSKKLEIAGQTYHMHVYYDLPKVSYTVNYYKLDKDTNDYKKVDGDTLTKEDKLTTTHRIDDSDVDPSYTSKYEGYKVNTKKNDEYEVTLNDKDGTYVINVYYDPIDTPPTPEPEKAKYKINYFKKNKDTGLYEKTSDSTGVIEEELNKEIKIKDVDSSYKTKYDDDGFGINEDVEGKVYKVVLNDKDITYELNVFYDPVFKYTEMYWIEDPDATQDYVIINVNGKDKKFILAEKSGEISSFVGTNVTVTDKSDIYSQYELVTIELSEYPTSDTVNDSNSTVVHQVYILKDEEEEIVDNDDDSTNPEDVIDTPDEPEDVDDVIDTPDEPEDVDDVIDTPQDSDDSDDVPTPKPQDPASGATGDNSSIVLILALIVILEMAMLSTYFVVGRKRKIR